MKKEFEAWAISSMSEEGHGFIGRYWWFESKSPVIPSHLEGCRVALFKTRALARQGLVSVRRGFEKARVVKVKVTIEEESCRKLR